MILGWVMPKITGLLTRELHCCVLPGNPVSATELEGHGSYHLRRAGSGGHIPCSACPKREDIFPVLQGPADHKKARRPLCLQNSYPGIDLRIAHWMILIYMYDTEECLVSVYAGWQICALPLAY